MWIVSTDEEPNTARAKAGAISGHQVPDQRWEVLHMDFITDLQTTAEGFDSILVCTDRLSRYSYLIPTKKSDTSLITARRLFQVVFTALMDLQND